MNYKVLYRKYRPKNFEELIGQDHIKKILVNSIINNKIAHAYIFTGPRGTGKTSTAKIFAKTINCTNKNAGICCDQCQNCLNFLSSPDIIEIDAASNNSVDNIREIIDQVNLVSTTGEYKIYIIDEVHMLTNSAWNAFLKTLEEPPHNVIFILATTDIQKVPITVLSRCQRFDFRRIDKGLILDNLKRICELESIEYEENALYEIAYLSDGCMRDALSTLDQLSKVSDIVNMKVLTDNYGIVTNDDLNTIYNAIIKNDMDELISTIRKIKENGSDIKIFIDKLSEFFLNKIIELKKKNSSNNVFKLVKNIIETLNELLVRINNNSNGYLLLELELLSFINDDSNNLTAREREQIISREIIQMDEKIEINNSITDHNKYKINDDFQKVRVNNVFVNPSKNYKSEFANNWSEFIENVKDINQLKILSKNTEVQIVSDTYAIISVKRNTEKTICNNALYDIENRFNTLYNKMYKMFFITDSEWKDIRNSFDKNKKYEILDEADFINIVDDAVSSAKELFGNDINIE